MAKSKAKALASVPEKQPAAPKAQLPADPRELSKVAAQRVAELASARISENTQRSYRAAIAYLAGWYHARFRAPFPLPAAPWPTNAVLTFVADHSVDQLADGSLALHMAVDPTASWVDCALVAAGVKARPGPLKWATLEHRLNVLAAAHRRAGVGDPLAEQRVQDALAGLRRKLDEFGLVRQRKAVPLVKADLAALLATCDASPVGVRDRALLLFGWPRRRSEISAARCESLEAGLDPASRAVTYIYTLTGSKTQRPGSKGLPIPIRGTAAEAMTAWLGLIASHGLTAASGPLFRRIRGNGPAARVTDKGISESTVVRMIERRVALAGLPALPGRSYSGHSLRRGFISEAVGKIPLPAVMEMTAHRTSRMVLEVYAEVSAGQNPGGELFDLDGTKTIK